jgi:THO complex subunit 1
MYGTFHVENETPLEDVQEGALDANGMPIDTEFYRTFWGLQKWFSDPTSALTSGAWDTISESLNVVLKRFSAEPVTVTEAPGTSEDQAQDPSAAGDGSSVKYLSSARLLPLQIRDATFRRNFLIQSLILIGWIENPLLKDWASKKPTERVMNDLQFMKKKIIRHLKRIPEHGSSFAEAIRKVLDGEITWSIWKQAGCPSEPFQVPERKGLQNLESVALFDDSKKFRTSSEAMYGVELGVPELDRLWNLTEDNLSSASP